ncbi:MAG: Malonyl CoA-acyl carrier protein transacylase, partial [uncultured Thermomicrobiales bacterium]
DAPRPAPIRPGGRGGNGHVGLDGLGVSRPGLPACRHGQGARRRRAGRRRGLRRRRPRARLPPFPDDLCGTGRRPAGHPRSAAGDPGDQRRVLDSPPGAEPPAAARVRRGAQPRGVRRARRRRRPRLRGRVATGTATRRADAGARRGGDGGGARPAHGRRRRGRGGGRGGSGQRERPGADGRLRPHRGGRAGDGAGARAGGEARRPAAGQRRLPFLPDGAGAGRDAAAPGCGGDPVGADAPGLERRRPHDLVPGGDSPRAGRADCGRRALGRYGAGDGGRGGDDFLRGGTGQSVSGPDHPLRARGDGRRRGGVAV